MLHCNLLPQCHSQCLAQKTCAEWHGLWAPVALSVQQHMSAKEYNSWNAIVRQIPWRLHALSEGLFCRWWKIVTTWFNEVLINYCSMEINSSRQFLIIFGPWLRFWELFGIATSETCFMTLDIMGSWIHFVSPSWFHKTLLFCLTFLRWKGRATQSMLIFSIWVLVVCHCASTFATVNWLRYL
jgi:hypothetical protein